MFAFDIERIAKIAISHNEWHTVAFCVSELYGWMDSPDEEIANVAAVIAKMIDHKLDEKTMGTELYSKLLRTVHNLYSYAVRVLVPKKEVLAVV